MHGGRIIVLLVKQYHGGLHLLQMMSKFQKLCANFMINGFAASWTFMNSY